MFEKVLDQLKNPVTAVIERSKTDDLKKGAIIAGILSGILALIGVLSKIIAIFTIFSKKLMGSSSKLGELRWEAMKEVELVGGFFKSWLIIILTIAAGAAILFAIAKLLKNQKDYAALLSMINSVLIVYTAGSIVSLIVSLIYSPIAWFVSFAVMIYVGYTLVFAFRESLEIENTNKLVLVTTAVLTATIVVLVILGAAISDISLKNLGLIFKTLSLASVKDFVGLMGMMSL